MPISPTDITVSLIPETTYGVTPTASASRYEMPIKTDNSPMSVKGNEIVSNTRRPNRAANGQKQGMKEVNGSYSFELKPSAMTDTLITNAISSGAFASSVAKAGKTDSSFSVIEALASNQYNTYGGCTVTSLEVNGQTGSTGAAVEISFEVLGATKTTGATNNALAVTAAPSGFLTTLDTMVISIGGTVIQAVEAKVAVSSDKSLRPVLGSSTSLGVGVAGNRSVTYTFKVYRDDFATENLVTGDAQEVFVKFGGTGDGYEFRSKAAYGSVPTLDGGGNSLMMDVTFVAAYDNTSATDLIVTKL